MRAFVDKAQGVGSIIVYSTVPTEITPQTFPIEYFAYVHLAYFTGDILLRTIAYAKRIRKFKSEILPLMEELFLEGLLEKSREVAIGLRYDRDPSEWDALAAARSFSVPFVLKHEVQVRRKSRRRPRTPSPEMSPVFVGGWRPIREVEMVLRNTPFKFGVLREDESVYIPSKDELEDDIRRKPDKVVNWVVCEAEAEKIRNWWAPEFRQDGSLKSDILIVTRSTNPLNPKIGALVLSGTHKEGTLGGALMTSTPGLLQEYDKQTGLSAYLNPHYQVLLRLYFNRFSTNNPKSLRVEKIELLGGSKL